MGEKTIAIRIDEEFHKKIKMRLAENGMTLKDYITTLINKDLNEVKSINLTAVPANKEVNAESVREAQKILDFVNGIINGDY